MAKNISQKKSFLKFLNKFKILHLLLLGLVIRLFLLFISSSHPDVGNHLDWGIKFWNYGSKNFYDMDIWGVSWPNQPFGSIYLFAVLKILKDLIFNSVTFLNDFIPLFPSKLVWILELNLHTWLVKLPFVLGDIGISYLIYRIIKTSYPKYKNLAVSLFLFNPIVIYNSTVWGQTDSLINLLSLTGLLLTIQRKYYLGVLLFLSSYYFKLSLIIYLPIFLFILYSRKSDWNKIIKSILLFLILTIFLVFPFLNDKNPISWLKYLYVDKVLNRQGGMLNGNAFNLWFIIFGADLTNSELVNFGRFTYKAWSQILVSIIFLPIILKFLKTKINFKNILFTAFMISFGCFLFLTSMHERYLYPIFPIFTILIFMLPSIFKLKSLILLTFIHLLNLYNLWFYPDIPILKNFLISYGFLPGRLMSAVLILFFVYYYVKYIRLTYENKT